jgi:hypothetical protein
MVKQKKGTIGRLSKRNRSGMFARRHGGGGHTDVVATTATNTLKTQSEQREKERAVNTNTTTRLSRHIVELPNGKKETIEHETTNTTATDVSRERIQSHLLEVTQELSRIRSMSTTDLLLESTSASELIRDMDILLYDFFSVRGGKKVVDENLKQHLEDSFDGSDGALFCAYPIDTILASRVELSEDELSVVVRNKLLWPLSGAASPLVTNDSSFRTKLHDFDVPAKVARFRVEMFFEDRSRAPIERMVTVDNVDKYMLAAIVRDKVTDNTKFELVLASDAKKKVQRIHNNRGLSAAERLSQMAYNFE